MAQPPARTAFQLIPALEHKSQKSVVSTVALDSSGQHLYVGTSDGQFEVYRISGSATDLRVVLGARRHVGKKVCHVLLLTWKKSCLDCSVNFAISWQIVMVIRDKVNS